jgi:hypothetical protein
MLGHKECYNYNIIIMLKQQENIKVNVGQSANQILRMKSSEERRVGYNDLVQQMK